MRKLLVTGAIVLGMVAALAGSAAAIPPTRESFDEVVTDTLTHICPFPVTVTSSLSGTETQFFDQNGELVKILVHVKEQDTFSANGVSVTGERFTFQVHVSFENGEVTSVVATGVAEKIRLPDGTLFLSAGVIDFLAQDVPFSLVTDHGVTGDIDALCAALSP